MQKVHRCYGKVKKKTSDDSELDSEESMHDLESPNSLLKKKKCKKFRSTTQCETSFPKEYL